MKVIEQVLWTIVLLLAVTALFFAHSAWVNYHTLQNHRNYLKEPGAQVQSWMTVRVVTRHFNLTESTVTRELGVNQSLTIDRMTIDAICQKQKLNCTQVVANINSLITNG